MSLSQNNSKKRGRATLSIRNARSDGTKGNPTKKKRGRRASMNKSKLETQLFYSLEGVEWGNPASRFSLPRDKETTE
ncbi:Laccase [Psidium guajava]|nr:Laccase [Psidium guajava]